MTHKQGKNKHCSSKLCLWWAKPQNSSLRSADVLGLKQRFKAWNVCWIGLRQCSFVGDGQIFLAGIILSLVHPQQILYRSSWKFEYLKQQNFMVNRYPDVFCWFFLVHWISWTKTYCRKLSLEQNYFPAKKHYDSRTSVGPAWGRAVHKA